jgi:manganese transport protein
VATGLVPSIPNETALYIAIGIIGATVMPHNLYLHSALVQTRKIQRDHKGIKRALKLNFIDSAVALNLAFFVNAAILVLAATVFFKTGRTDVAEIKQAHQLLAPMLGSNLAPTLFAIALIAAGQSSTVTGTLAGQIVMEGYLRLRINPWVRRLLTRLVAIIPAVIVILINGEKNIDSLLVLSQVILSLQLGFAIIPLIHFVSDRQTMGAFTIKPIVQFLAWLITAILVFLNMRMVIGQAGVYFQESGHIFWKTVIIVGGLLFVALLLISIFYPLLKRKPLAATMPIPHLPTGLIGSPVVPQYNRIAIALAFGKEDHSLLAHAMGQATPNTTFILIHIAESVSASFLGSEADDFESRKDKENLEAYAIQLKEKGLQAEVILGFRNRKTEIPRLVKEANADLLIIGAHGHKGVKDWIYGETIDAVRHQLKIPVLIVSS